MEMLKSDLETVLELEREGERRLEEAEAAARGMLENYRQRAQELRQTTERQLVREREERLARVERELAERVAQLQDRFAGQKESLVRKARRNREAALTQILSWLGGEGG